MCSIDFYEAEMFSICQNYLVINGMDALYYAASLQY